MPHPIPAKADFPDWLSPMLVKELRQGVRTRVFVLVFILLQVLLLTIVSLSLLTATVSGNTDDYTVYFWIMVGLPLLVILPMTALGAIGGEIRANTLELIFLTRLTAFRIVFGKWFAIFAQSVLLVSAVLPYQVLRYFMGGINITNELIAIASMLGGSALLSAVATGMSAYPTRIIRPLVGVMVVLLFFMGSQLSYGSRMYYRRSSSGFGPGTEWLEITGFILCGLLFLFLMLEIGAAKIAPPAENHSAPMRLLALGGFVVTLTASLLNPVNSTQGLTFTAFLTAFCICAAALCETPRAIPSIYRPFALRGLLGRLAGRLLYPGWHTGVFFTLLVFGLFGWLMASQEMFDGRAGAVWFIAAAGALLFPVALIRGFFPNTDKAIALFISIQGGSAIVTVFCQVCDNVLKTSLSKLLSVLPLSALILAFNDSQETAAGRLVAVSFTTLASLVALFVAVRRPFRQTRALEAECLQMPAPTAADATLA